MAKIKLYKCFEHWQNNGVIYLFSDPHFEDADCKHMDPNWVSPDEQVRLINSVVGKNDTLIILGDIGNVDYIKKLKGYKVLLTGNHDKGNSNYKSHYLVRGICDGMSPLEVETDSGLEADAIAERWRIAYNANVSVLNSGLFDEVYDGPLFINDKILLSHERIDLPFGVNIHGHEHNGEKKIVKEVDDIKSVSYNICADVIGYLPIRLEELVDEKTDTIHRLAIDNAIKRKELQELENDG